MSPAALIYRKCSSEGRSGLSPEPFVEEEEA